MAEFSRRLLLSHLNGWLTSSDKVIDAMTDDLGLEGERLSTLI